MMRVYLTGYGGFLGSATRIALHASTRETSQEGLELHLLGRTPPQELASNEMHTSLDLANPPGLERVADLPAPDVVIHLAARIGWPVVPLAELYAPNVLATARLAQACADWDARMVFASAAILHGVQAEHIEADSPVNPDTPYGRSKWLGEEMIAASGISYAALRFGGLFGLGGPAHLGLNKALDAAQQGQRPAINAAGTARRSYIHVADAAQACVLAARAAPDSVHMGAHLIAGPDQTLEALLQAVCDRFLPGQLPDRRSGGTARDQVIEPSSAYPAARSVNEALADMPTIGPAGIGASVGHKVP